MQSGYSKFLFFIKLQLTITLGGMAIFMIEKLYNRYNEINYLKEKNKPNKAKKLERNNYFILIALAIQIGVILYSNRYFSKFQKKFVRSLYYLPNSKKFELNL